ncbi:MAG: hypothetical protein IJL76_02730 [Bacilli bacterium]|nr:hypothetical protein [Bacilli bacterium]
MQKLKIQYAIFVFIVFMILGIVVINQKMTPIFEKKADQKINDYINEKYNDLKDVKKSKTKFKNNKYEKIITNKNNDNYYFKIYYHNKKITDTYKKDYLEGATLLNHISKKIQKDIENKIDKKYKVIIDKKLNKFSEKSRESIIKEKDLLSSEIYVLEIKLNIKADKSTITDTIYQVDKKLKKENIKSKAYNFIVKDTDSTNEIIINNLTVNKDLKLIINDIINNKNSNYLRENNITFEKID